MHLERNGLGDLVNGWYPIPQNPIMNPGNNSLSNPIMNAVKAAAVAGKAKGIGDLVTGNYPVPWNPIVNGGSSSDRPRAMMADTSNAIATSVASMQAGPTATLSGFELQTLRDAMGMRGLGQDSSNPLDQLSTITGDFTGFMGSQTFGYSNWLVWGGGALALWLIFANKKQAGTSRYHRARKAISAF